MLRKRAERSMADLICGAESSNVFDFFVRLLVGLQPSLERGDLGARPGEQLRTAQAAAGLHELRGREVFLIHDETGGQFQERRALVGAADEDARDAKIAGADVELRADRGAQRGREARVRPYLATCRNTLRQLGRAEGLIGEHDFATQRVSRGYRAQRGELVEITVEHHAEQAGAARHREAALPAFIDGVVIHLLAGFQAQVGREYLARLVVHGDADPIDEESDARKRGDRNDDGEHQHSELAGAPFAHQRAEGQGQCPHEGVLIPGVPSPCSGRVRIAMPPRGRA